MSRAELRGFECGGAAPSEVRPVRVAVLVSMYVSGEWRSSGIGRRLVGSFKDWARQQRADRISVGAFASNDDAIRFYQRMGFAPLKLILEGDVPPG